MTDQLDTLVTIAGADFALVETDGDWSDFDPEAHDLPLEFVGSHCWDAFLCAYRVDDRLLLDSASVGWSEVHAQGKGPTLWGHRARRCEHEGVVWARYDLARPIDFTGSMLIGRNPRPGLLIPWSFRYREVIECIFASGRLRDRVDATAEMERYRQIHAALPPLDARSEAAWQERRSYAQFFASRRRERGG